jgi:hypothetical protein
VERPSARAWIEDALFLLSHPSCRDADASRQETSMADSTALRKAKTAKQDEFYTQYADIQAEINAYLEYDPDTFKGKTVLLPCDDPEWSNFTRFFAENFSALGLKKLISTSYAPDTKREKYGVLFDWAAGDIDKSRGRIFVLDRDVTGDGKINYDDIKWQYLRGDGDFRSEEVCRLRDEADIIVTNPPFSLFREFLTWIVTAGKSFLIIGNMNAITYKEVFPLIMSNRMWLGESIHSGDREFGVPKEYPLEAAGWRVDEKGNRFIRVKGVRWFTNLEHGRRHQPLQLMTMADNKKYSRHKEVKCVGYNKYDNYDAIEVPFTDAIPSDYSGIMGVPISFLDKYCPEQFEIVGITKTWFGAANKVYPEQIEVSPNGKRKRVTKLNDGASLKLTKEPDGETYYLVDEAPYTQLYARILIRYRMEK